MTGRPFEDRPDAGRRLGAALHDLDLPAPVVLGLPRGGVVVAAEVATALATPLDVVVVRKLGVPWQPELAMGAVGEDGAVVVNEDVVRRARVSAEQLAGVAARERAEVARRALAFWHGRPRVAVTGRTVVVVDDGLATGATARAALHVLRARGAGRLVLAVPVAPRDTVSALAADADQVLALLAPAAFGAVGQYYADFTQTSDRAVMALLAAGHRFEEPHGDG